MRLLKKDDTSKAIVFLMVDSTDHITGKTGLTPTVTISKNGGAFASPSGTVSEIGNGWYKFTPAAADVDTLGPLLIHATATGADPVDIEYQVVAFDPYAATNLGLSNLDTTVSSRSSHSAVDVWSVASRTITGGTVDTLTNKTGFELSAAGIDAIWDELRTGHTTVGSFGYYIDAAISSRSNHAPADVWNVASRTVTGGTIDTLNDRTGFQLSAAGIDAIWDEPRSEHTIPGTFGAVSEWAGGDSEGSDWTDDEKQQIRYRLGIDGTTQAPSTNAPHLGSTYSTLDDLAAHVSTRLAASDYMAPDNASIASIKSKTDAYLDATVSSRLAASDYVAPDNTSISAIKSRTDAYLDAAVSSRLASSAYVAPDNASITAIKAKTDKLTFNEDNYVYAVGVGGSDGTDWTDAEKQQIRYRLGIDGTTESPSTNTPHLGSSYADLDQLASHGDSAWATVSPAAIWSHDTRTITGGTVTTVNDKSGYRLSAQGVDDIWDEPRSGHTITGSFGYYLDAAISSRSTFNPNTDQVTVAINNDKAGYSLEPDQSSVIIGQVNNLGGTGLAAVAGAVWDASRDDHTETGTFGAVSEWAGGGSEGSDWTDAEKKQIRYRLGIDGTTQAPSTNTPHLGNSYSTLDDLATHVSTRLAASDYEAPDNASISAIKTQTDKLQFDSNNYVYAVGVGGGGGTDWTDDEKKQIRYRLGIDGTTASPQSNTPHLGSTYSTLDDLAAHVSTRLAASDYVPPDNASISEIKTQTDKLTFDTDNYVYAIATNATTDWTDNEKQQIRYRLGIDGTTETPSTNTPHLGSTYSTLDDLAAHVSTRLATSDYVPPDNASISAIKTKTDKLTFDTNNYVYSIATNASTDWTATEREQIRYRLGIDGTTQSPGANTPHLGSTYPTLDSLGSLVSTRLAAADYTPPDNVSISAIKTKTDRLTFNEDNYIYAVGVGGGGGTDWTDDEKKQIRYRLGVDGNTQTPSTNVPHLGSTYSTLDDVGSLVASRLAAEDYVAPDNASILAIKDKTDKLQFNTENAVKSTLSGETVAVELTTQAIDTIIDNFWDEPTTEHTVSGSFGALVSTKLSKLSFNPDNYVYADIGESAGIGSILIDHNYGGTDNLRYVTPGGNGIANGIIKAYLKEDYEAGRISEGYIKGGTMTASDGRWRKPLALDPNTYILVFYKPGEYGITAVEVTVTE